MVLDLNKRPIADDGIEPGDIGLPLRRRRARL
jgi:hypothetical protein